MADTGLLELADEAARWAKSNFKNPGDARNFAARASEALRALSAECGVKALERLRQVATDELRNTGLLMSNPPQSSAAWDIRNAIDREIDSARSALVPGVGEPVADDAAVLIATYTNYRGETAVRRIIPKSVRYGSTEWHPEPQWLLLAWDNDKQSDREFALKDFGNPTPPSAAVRDALKKIEAKAKSIADDPMQANRGLWAACADEVRAILSGLGESSTSSDGINPVQGAESASGAHVAGRTAGANPATGAHPAADREAVARIIDPEAWTIEPWNENWRVVVANRKEKALAKADAILSTGAR